MTQEQLAAFVSRLERFAQRQPKTYKIRVGLLATLGYAYIVLILGLFGGTIALLIVAIVNNHPLSGVFSQLLIVLLVPLLLIVRSLSDALTFRIPTPSGILLDRRTTPSLFHLLDELTAALECPTLDRVILNSHFNAAVVQIPRFGILGGYQNYLTIGLPLLQSLDVEQFKAVLAHELGHLSGHHSRFAGRIYRMRQTWDLILKRFSPETPRGMNILFTPFLRWYIPFFNAYSFVLARADEYEADRRALELVGKMTTGSALVNTNIKALSEVHFWQHLYRQVSRSSDPPHHPFTELGKMLQIPLATTQQQQWLEQILAVPTDFGDTHPCLSDRLTALNISLQDLPSLLTPIDRTAAEQLLGEALPDLIQQFNQNWLTSISLQWQEQYHHSQQMQHRLTLLDSKAATYLLTFDEAWEQAQLTLQFRTEAEAISLLEFLLLRKSDHVSAHFLLGRILIQSDDRRGIEHLEIAMDHDPDTLMTSCQLIYDFLRRRGQETKARQYLQEIEDYLREFDLAQRERSQFRWSDRFCVPHFPASVFLSLRQQLAKYPEVKTAYLVRRIVRYLPQKPCYILGIERTRKGVADRELLHRLTQELDCPADTIIILLEGSHWRLHRILKRTSGEFLYQGSNRCRPR